GEGGGSIKDGGRVRGERATRNSPSPVPPSLTKASAGHPVSPPSGRLRPASAGFGARGRKHRAANRFVASAPHKRSGFGCWQRMDYKPAMAHSSPSILICGAGIAGVAAAYALTVDHGLGNVVMVEPGNPLSLTSDKSSEAYRNWWPGPDRAMTAFMDRSIDLIEGIARATDNRINLNRRGYVFATADAGKIPFLRDMAKMAEARGGGPARFHDTASSVYTPSPEHGFDFALTGADVLTDTNLIRR